jgi:hypothetical protein
VKSPKRTSRKTTVSSIATMLAAAMLSACQASGGATPTTPAASLQSPSAVPASPSSVAITPRPTATPLPLAVPRPTDLPTDGTCESGHTCLGLLSAGTYHTKVFSPGFQFVMPTAGWENVADAGGDLGLLSIDSPGDAIFFFRQPRPANSDGAPVSGVETKVDAIATWVAGNPTFTVSPVTKVSIGGLDGKRMDLAIAPGVESHQTDCPVQVCVLLFRGRDPSSKPTWEWDWGFAGPERQRLYLLSAKDGVVAIFVDSLDGTTFDALAKAADEILATMKFDAP